jgi:hypothetical protein
MDIITSININQLSPNSNRSDNAADTLVRRTNAGSQADTMQPESKGEETHIAFKPPLNTSLQKAATSIRVADAAMKTIGNYIGRMKEQLDAIIVKNYPPFPPDSEERIKILRSYSAFRREIDALTIPPIDDGAAMIMADRGVVPHPGNQDALIPSRPVHAGPGGLDIPVLADTAGDAEVSAARKSLDAAQAKLVERRAALRNDAAGLAGATDMTETTAERKSAELGRTLAQDPAATFTAMRPQLSQLLL